MILLLQEYFKEYPVKREIIEKLFENGISIKNKRLYLNDIEVSISAVAKAFNINRKTIYETIEFIEKNLPVKYAMENIRSMADIKNVSLLMGDEILTIHINIGSFQKVLMEILDIIKKYSVYLKEIYSYNADTGKESYIRIIFYGQISPKVFEELDNISGIKKIDIISNEKIELICSKCEVRICPKKISSRLNNLRKDI